MRYIFVLLWLAPSAVGAEFYKCVSESGQTTYADQPCGPQAQEIQARVDQAAPDALSSRIKARESLRETRRYISLRRVEREIRESKGLIRSYNLKMRRQLAALRASKRISSNNLAGATRDVGLAQQMTAVTAKYGALIAAERAELDRLFKLRLELMGR